MRSVLCFGDSNTYGQTTAARINDRYGPHQRWPRILQRKLGADWLVIEEGLSGRTTVNDDPIEGAEKNGRTYLKPCILSHKPLDMIVLMLGTNDLKIRFNKTSAEIAMGIGALVQDIKSLPAGHDARGPEIMVVSPPPILEDLKGWESMFEGGLEKSRQLADEYERIADANEVHFFDAGSVVKSGERDGFHLDVDAHATLGLALALEIESIGWQPTTE